MHRPVYLYPLFFTRTAFAVAFMSFLQGAYAAESTAGNRAIEEVNIVELRNQRSAVGSRLGLNVMETPASVSLIEKDALQLRGDHSTAQALGRAPGFAPVGMQAFAGSALSARGFSGNASVGQLYDGNRLFVSGGAMSFPVDTWPFERIEVLAGPASVLYGSGTIGGAVNYIPRQIQRGAPAHEVLLAAGSWDTARLGLASTGPLGEAAGYRINGVFNKTDGYVERNSNERWAVSAAVEYDVMPNLRMTLMFDGARIDDQGYFGTPLIDGRIDSRTRRLNYNAEDAGTRFDNNWTRVRLDWQPSERVTVRNETYYLDTSRDFRNVENYTWAPDTRQINRSFNFGTDISQSQAGNRLDVQIESSLFQLPARLLVGAEVNYIDYGVNSVSSAGTPVDPYDFVPGRYNAGSGLSPNLITKTDQAALYAEGVVDLNSRIKLLAGVRAERMELDRTNPADGSKVTLDFTPTTWRLGSVYALGDSASLYAQYVVGNDAAGSLISLPALGAERLQTGRQAEIGLKQGFWDDRGQWTIAAYRISKNNLVSRDPLLPNVAQQIGRQSSRGVEVSATLQPGTRLVLDANATILEARFDEFNELVGGTVTPREGNLPPNTPERLASVWAHYQATAKWNIGGGIRYVGKRYSNNANTLGIPSYSVADAALRYSWREDIELTARVRNLFDRTWVVQPYNAGLQWALGDPRNFELSLRMTL